MTYIDLDGVLANLSDYVLDKDSDAFESDSNFNIFAFDDYQDLFLHSKTIESNFVMLQSDYRVLTALPSIEAFIKFNKDRASLSEILRRYQILRTNKVTWCKNHNIPVERLIIVNNRHEKLLYCTENDVLFDDYKPTVDEWISKGGVAILIKSNSSVFESDQGDF